MSTSNRSSRPLHDPTALRLSDARPSADGSRRRGRVISAIERREKMRSAQRLVATCRTVASEHGEPCERIFAAEVVDVSDEGVGLRIDNASGVIDPAAACGTSIAVELPPPAGEPLCVLGVIRWCKSEGVPRWRVVRLGIEFQSQDAPTGRVLADLVALDCAVGA